jgi:OOP family OmpA-OmpF porin
MSLRIFRLTTLGLALLLPACSLTPVASGVPGYLTTLRGELLTNADGRCWRTADWRPALAVPECDPEVVRAREEEKVAAEEEAKKKTEEEMVKKKDAGEEEAEAEAEAGVAVAGAAGAAAAVGADAVATFASAPEAGGAALRFRDEVVFEPLVLNSDASFFFGADQLTPEGRNAVIEMAGIIKARRAEDLRIAVVGHTDRIGTDSANLALSRRRAVAVKTALVTAGIPATAIETAGMGAMKPLTVRENCPDQLVKCELIACLKPDRRVEIRTRGRMQNGTRQVPVQGRIEWPQAPAAAMPATAAMCSAS